MLSHFRVQNHVAPALLRVNKNKTWPGHIFILKPKTENLVHGVMVLSHGAIAEYEESDEKETGRIKWSMFCVEDGQDHTDLLLWLTRQYGIKIGNGKLVFLPTKDRAPKEDVLVGFDVMPLSLEDGKGGYHYVIGITAQTAKEILEKWAAF